MRATILVLALLFGLGTAPEIPLPPTLQAGTRDDRPNGALQRRRGSDPGPQPYILQAG